MTADTFREILKRTPFEPFRGTAIIPAGGTNDVDAFLPRQTVQFTWTVGSE